MSADLANAGAMLAGQLGELSTRPSVDACDQMVRSLAEVATTVRQLRTELETGEQPTV